MHSRLFTRASVCWLIAAGATGALGIATGQDTGDAKTKIVRVMAGTDFLQTGPGTQAMLPTGNTMTLVQLHGVPIQGLGELGNTDTVMLRDEDAIFSDDVTPDTVITVPITLEALSLQGTVTGPGGAACTVTLTLAPSPASTGDLYLKVTSTTGGTYRSKITVWVTGVFSPGPPTCYGPIPPTKCVLNQKGGTWSIFPLPNELLVTGSYPNIQVNQHVPPPPIPPGYVDFYISALQTDSSQTAAHVTCEAFQAAGTACPGPAGEPGN